MKWTDAKGKTVNNWQSLLESWVRKPNERKAKLEILVGGLSEAMQSSPSHRRKVADGN
jgi:hypothetical protein